MSVDNFGMMNEAYFVGRQELVNWVNDLLELNISKVEQIATGAIPAQIIDSVYPGIVQMKKLDFGAKYEYEWVNNWKVVQIAFKKIGCEKFVPVDNLMKARHLDNLEFLQWLYQWHKRISGDGLCDYEAIQQRSLAKNGKTYKFNRSDGSGAAKPRSRPTSRPSDSAGSVAGGSRKRKPVGTTTAGKQPVRSSGYGVVRSKPKQQAGRSNGGRSGGSTSSSSRGGNSARQTRAGGSSKSLQAVTKAKEAAEKQIEELTIVAKDLEKERDFYFNKILTIESEAKQQDQQETEFMKKLYEILYATNEAAGEAGGDVGMAGGGLSTDEVVGSVVQSSSAKSPDSVSSKPKSEISDEMLGTDDLLTVDDLHDDDGLLVDAEMF